MRFEIGFVHLIHRLTDRSTEHQTQHHNRALGAASAAALALHAELQQQPQPPTSQLLLREYGEAFARAAEALLAAAAPKPPEAEPPEAEEAETEEAEAREERGVLVALLERYSDRLVALVARKAGTVVA